MANTISQKLRIKEGSSLLTFHAPADFKKSLIGLPAKVTISDAAKSYDQIHWFILNKAQLEKEMNKVLKLVKDEVVLWMYYPKGTSKIQSDLTRDKGWDNLLKHGDKLTWISLLSFDDTWSVFGCRLKNESDKKKEAGPKEEREVFKYVNPATKEVRLPDDLTAAFKKNKKQSEAFEVLSFSNKKEYIEWVVTAKREETRKERVAGTIERLGKGWKNPANR
ncbi:MAG: YdeI/OmpD-associated family protein [Chitinophagaceae bacterium]